VKIGEGRRSGAFGGLGSRLARPFFGESRCEKTRSLLRPKLDLERRASIVFRLGFDEKNSAASVHAD